MGEKRAVLLTVVMADNYIVMPGESVHISMRDGVYYVSRNHLDFGLAKEVLGDVIKEAEELAHEFDAVVVKTDFDSHQLEVRAEL